MNGLLFLLKKGKDKVDWNKAVRFTIQLLFILLMPSVYTAAFNGAKYLFTQMGLKEPFRFDSFLLILTVLLAYTFVFGRFFCGFACFFGTFGEWVYDIFQFICKKLKRKPWRIGAKTDRILACIKYFILAGICLMCYMGVWSSTQGMSPWDVFSMISAGRFELTGYTAGVIVLILIVAGMAVKERFFCRYLCPMGAIFTLVPVLPFFSLHKNRNSCKKGCSACTKVCPSSIDLPDSKSLAVSGDCFMCQHCIRSCTVYKLNKKMNPPNIKSNIGSGIAFVQGDELWFMLLRAALLYAVLSFAGA